MPGRHLTARPRRRPPARRRRRRSAASTGLAALGREDHLGHRRRARQGADVGGLDRGHGTPLAAARAGGQCPSACGSGCRRPAGRRGEGGLRLVGPADDVHPQRRRARRGSRAPGDWIRPDPGPSAVEEARRSAGADHGAVEARHARRSRRACARRAATRSCRTPACSSSRPPVVLGRLDGSRTGRSRRSVAKPRCPSGG